MVKDLSHLNVNYNRWIDEVGWQEYYNPKQLRIIIKRYNSYGTKRKKDYT